MSNLPDIHTVQIIGARMVGVSVTYTAEMYGQLGINASAVIKAFEK